MLAKATFYIQGYSLHSNVHLKVNCGDFNITDATVFCFSAGQIPTVVCYCSLGYRSCMYADTVMKAIKNSPVLGLYFSFHSTDALCLNTCLCI